ncbi:MAG: hydrogenase maturation nickel metallochaperone HypA [Planctomycetota bacterium]|nr:MAG: hydrogenase maturation nickel metallochaperone HypA [Planctomycetota bacterium]REJ96754.1 MAG: hydrogenase maturation nickel metallochaperone HypA [Planctomycetota bacterium]REK25164.1 MAG: hydrogenase maturation nickel metallochaperone HypA [Planctomycetota bacterium]REK38805.1 MAG: hydrogenase maturation nickel metallochaperone HypA [Planctomycetota bacterium]
MHEASLVRSLLSQVSNLLLEHNGESVEIIRVEMGPLSGVERLLLEIAFEQQVHDTLCRGATLQVEEVPLSAVCRDCGDEFDIERFRFVCPSCNSTRVRVTGGDEFRLLDVDIQTKEEALPR